MNVILDLSPVFAVIMQIINKIKVRFLVFETRTWINSTFSDFDHLQMRNIDLSPSMVKAPAKCRAH